MNENLTTYLPLVAKCRSKLEEAFQAAVVVDEAATDDRTKYLVGIAVGAIEGVRGIEVLLHSELFVQALILCRCNFESLVVANAVTSDATASKLFEKGSLEQFRARIKDLGLLDQIRGLDETIDGLHPDSPKALQWRKLFDQFEARTQPDRTKSLFYSSYRVLSTYVHPDLWRLFETVTIDGGKMTVEPQTKAKTEVLLLGLGLMGALGAMMMLNSEVGGIGFADNLCSDLEQLLNEAMDLVGKPPDDQSTTSPLKP